MLYEWTHSCLLHSPPKNVDYRVCEGNKNRLQLQPLLLCHLMVLPVLLMSCCTGPAGVDHQSTASSVLKLFPCLEAVTGITSSVTSQVFAPHCFPLDAPTGTLSSHLCFRRFSHSLNLPGNKQEEFAGQVTSVLLWNSLQCMFNNVLQSCMMKEHWLTWELLKSLNLPKYSGVIDTAVCWVKTMKNDY